MPPTTSRGNELPQRRTDAVRDLYDFLSGHAEARAKLVMPYFDVGEVLKLDDPDDGTVIALDNMSTPMPDCVIPAHLQSSIIAGDRVLCVLVREYVYVLGDVT